MALPGRDEARNWVGLTVVDREGAELGACTAVLADDATGLPEWMYVEIDGVSAVVPAVDADGSEGRVTVTVTRAQVSGAPSVGGSLELSTEQEADLYRHYGIDVSREASETLLPAAATEDTSTVAEDTAAPADTSTAADTPSAGSRAPVVAAVALAAVAGVGVVRARTRRPVVRQSWPQRLWSRRPWAPPPPSRAELVAAQAVAVSLRARAGARRAGRVAAPIAAAAAESARHRALQAGEGARHLGLTLVPVAAAAAESVRHRATLGAEEIRHVARLTSQSAVTRVRARG